MNNTLRNLLAKNIVRFTFRKVDGTIRTAIGTRNLALAQAYLHTKAETRNFVIPTPKGEEQPYSYYDLEKNGWRSYKPELLMSIDGFVALDYRGETPVKPVEINNPKPTPTPVREIPVERKPVSTPTEKGGEIPTGGKFGGGIGMGGFGGFGGGFGGGEEIPVVGTPTPVGEGVAMPVGGIPIEVFARMVAKYVVEELATRLQG